MVESNAQKLIAEANLALGSQQYAAAEEIQRRLIEISEAQSADVTQIADEVEKLAGIHFQQKKFRLAASEYEHVLKSRESSLPPTDSRILRVLRWLGKSHFHEQEYDSAEGAFRRALAASEALPDAHQETGHFLYELGFLLYFVGRYREAEPYLLRALSLCESLYGGSHPDTAKVLERVALSYEQCPDLGKDPEPYFQKAAQALNSREEHKSEYLANLCRWAGCVADRNRFDEADQLYGEVLTLIEPYASHPQLHWILSDCVKYFQSRGKQSLVAHLIAKETQYDAYGELVRQTLEHAEQSLPGNDPELADALLSAGNHAIFQRKYSEAETLLRRALDVNIKAHGEESEAVAANLNRLCVVARELEKPNEAEMAIQRALQIAKKSLLNSHVYPRTIETLASLRETQGRIEEATSLYKEAIVHFERLYGYPSYETIESLYRQSGHFLRVGNFVDAEKAIRRAIETMDQIDGISDYEKSDYMATLANALEGLGRMDESEEAGKQSHELFERAQKEAEAAE